MNDAAVRRYLTIKEALAETLGDLSGLRAVDLGCGRGPATRALARLGAEAIGVDPNAEAIAEAEARGARDGVEARYQVGSGDATGFESGSADLVLLSNSLHHYPDPAAGLAEALRLVKPGGRLVVLEPEAPDPFYSVMRFIDDEGPVYALVIGLLDRMVAGGSATHALRLQYAERYPAETASALLAKLTAVNAERRLDPADQPAFEAAFDAAIERDADGGYFTCWQRLDVFRRTAEVER